MIDRQMLEELFVATRTARREGHVTWDIDDACRWSFFFVDEDRDRLIAAGEALARAGYEVVGLLEPHEDDDDRETLYLRVDRVEHHTIDSLLARNAELYAFAEAHGLGDYDGMDVGAIDAA